MSETKHTPLPWVKLPAIGEYSMSKEDHDFILTAVNAHYALVGACEKAGNEAWEARQLISKLSAYLAPSESPRIRSIIEGLTAAETATRLAIAKAKGAA